MIGDTTNGVKGCRGWYYGLRVRHAADDLGSRVTFNVFTRDGRKIEGLEASGCRTTGLARRMGDERRGYQHVAQEAIRDHPDEGEGG